MIHLLKVVLLVGLFSKIGLSQISGKVFDSEVQPIVFANVLLYDAKDTSFITGVFSDEQGYFQIESDFNGKVVLGVSVIGYLDHFSRSFEWGTNFATLDLGTITLQEDENRLEGVVVSARKSIIQNTKEGKVFNVQSSLMTLGSNALQVLERLPGILVDKRNNQFSLNGQSGVTVMFDGRRMPLSMEELIAMLESTVADNIQNIELITSPNSKYDAEGGGGIINIVFKKGENQGQNLTVNTTLGYGFREKGSGSLAYTLGTRRLNLSASYSLNHDKSKSGFAGEGTSHIPVIGMSKGTFSTFFNNNVTNHNSNLGLKFDLNADTEIGIDLAYLYGRNHAVSNVNNTRDVRNREYVRSELESNGNILKQNFISSFYVQRQLTDKSKFNFDVNYLIYSNDSPSINTSKYFDRNNVSLVPENEIFTLGNKSESMSKIQLGVVKADYEFSISDIIKGETGIKGSFSRNENDSKIETYVDGIWEIDPRSQSVIFSDEKLFAAYAQFNVTPNEKSSIDVGLRYEYWNRIIPGSEETFLISKLFPTFAYQINLTDKSLLRFNYNRRISRPSYVDLVASLYYNDPTAIFTGNPLLKPTLIDVLKGEYALDGFNVALSAQRELNPIIRYQLSANANNDILIISPQNADFQNSLNLFLSYPLQWAKNARLSVSSTTSLRKYQISYSPNTASRTYVNQSINFSQTFELPFQFNAEFSGWRNFRNYTGTSKQEGFGIINFGLSKKLKNNLGSLQFSITDLFKSFSIDTDLNGMTPIVYDIDTVSNYKDESGLSRIYKLTYSKSFGGAFHNKKRNFGVEEERQRVD